MRIRRSHKGQEHEYTLKIILVIITIVVIGLLVYSQRKTIYNMIQPFLYSKPKADSTNAYSFIAFKVGLTDENGVPLADDKLPHNCTKDPGGAGYDCPIGSKLYAYVRIRNTGSQQRTIYATPLVSYGCNSKGECEQEVPYRSQKACLVPSGQEVNCPADVALPLQRLQVYRIYPQAVCLVDDCYTPGSTDINDIISLNKNEWITITTTMPAVVPINAH